MTKSLRRGLHFTQRPNTLSSHLASQPCLLTHRKLPRLSVSALVHSNQLLLSHRITDFATSFHPFSAPPVRIGKSLSIRPYVGRGRTRKPSSHRGSNYASRMKHSQEGFLVSPRKGRTQRILRPPRELIRFSIFYKKIIPHFNTWCQQLIFNLSCWRSEIKVHFLTYKNYYTIKNNQVSRTCF